MIHQCLQSAEFFGSTGTNDFFPNNREQLQRTDPMGYAFMERMWGSEVKQKRP